MSFRRLILLLVASILVFSLSNLSALDGYNLMNMQGEQMWPTFDGKPPATEVKQGWEEGAWVNEAKTVFTNEAGVIKEKIVFGYQADAWVQQQKHVPTFVEGKVTEVVISSFSADTWTPAMAYQLTRDASGNLTATKMVVMYGDITMDFMTTVGTFATDGTLEKSTTTVADFQDPAKKKIQETTYTFTSTTITMVMTKNTDDNGDILPNSEMVNESKIVLTVDDQDRLIENLNQTWKDGAWVNDTKETSVYTTDKTVATTVDWTGSAWGTEPSSRMTSTYQNGKLMEMVRESTPNGGTFGNSDRTVYTYGTSSLQNFTFGSGLVTSRTLDGSVVLTVQGTNPGTVSLQVSDMAGRSISVNETRYTDLYQANIPSSATLLVYRLRHGSDMQGGIIRPVR
ncbi:MAG: hypothetical protein HQK83_09110 [Fibrobacteria bacterium]|nr:hypothetical protein [Fibrobacteria bacterium]